MFQVEKSHSPRPPPNLLLVTFSQDTLAVPLPPICLFHRNFPYNELISFVHPCGMMKVED